jgi:hypothetical protein
MDQQATVAIGFDGAPMLSMNQTPNADKKIKI